jgi:hypothetical protein
VVHCHFGYNRKAREDRGKDSCLSNPPPLMEMSKNPLKRCKEGGMQPMLLRLYTGGYNYTTRLKQLD